MTTLKAELDARRAEFMKTAPPDKAAAFQRGVDELAASGIAERAIKAGDMAPDFTLANARGERVALSALLARGPAVLVFYRGGWCPYCNLQLVAAAWIDVEYRNRAETDEIVAAVRALTARAAA